MTKVRDLRNMSRKDLTDDELSGRIIALAEEQNRLAGLQKGCEDNLQGLLEERYRRKAER